MQTMMQTTRQQLVQQPAGCSPRCCSSGIVVSSSRVSSITTRSGATGRSLAPTTPLLAAIHTRPLRLQRAPLVRAQGGGSNGSSGDNDPQQQQQGGGEDPGLQVVKEVEQKLRRRGVDRSTAREILRAWREQGVDSPEALRKLLVDNSLRNVRFVAGQLLFDGLAAGVSFYTAEAIKQTEAFGPVWSLPAQYTFLSVGFYFTIGVLFTMTTLGATVAALQQYNRTAGDVLEAMKELAGPEDERLRRRREAAAAAARGSLADVVGSARAAVDSLKVVNALNSISELLKGQVDLAGGKLEPRDLYRDLCAYLTLERAERQSGFDASAYGLTDAQAANIAIVFNSFDTNGDGELQIDEFERLCAATFTPLSPDEAAEALRLIDRNNDGRLQFCEFVAWWTQKVEVPPAAADSQQQQQPEPAATASAK